MTSGMELKLTRVQARITGKALAAILECHPSSVTINEARAVVTEEYARRYLDALGLLEERRRRHELVQRGIVRDVIDGSRRSGASE